MNRYVSLLALGAALAVVASAAADGCRRVAPHRAVVQHHVPVLRQQVYHDQAYYHAYAPYANYSIYGTDPSGELKLIREELGRIREAIQGHAPLPPQVMPPQQQQQAPLPPPEGKTSGSPGKSSGSPGKSFKASDAQPAKWAAYAKVACIKCHSENGRQDKGLAVVMADGKLADPGPLMRKEIFLRVSLGEMPQGGQPPDDEALQELAEWARGK